ncbi:uncharacterized protein LOC122500526 isoform X2 [Leptopilina heterotoma]|uniref:uncharacterized protein LOC122500526 isoform X2 n=1 Tax=Leptopilina heterotoma TaxID=63436 RepID=UPI001CA8A1FD|nr:uncharacterized protein LOC122500526 isoform X2 [Leptopilina heterotoma]
MELVLSPGFIGDNDGSPFHNEDVHEWSHVDQLTGMLENARIENSRWQTKNQGAAQSYGKVVDSRERNSADGNLVQRAQRKVEVFQSQGAGGKSIQVVRASQWSSSRVSDLIHSSSLAKSPIEQHMNQLESGIKSRLNDYKDLDSLSSLCRKLHSKVINDSHSLFFGHNSAFLTDEKLSKAFEVIDRNKSLFNEKKSNSNEDLASLTDEKESLSPSNFTRDYRVRRSLQLTNKKTGKDTNNSNVKLADLNNSENDLYISKLSELKNPQARLRKKHDDDKVTKNSYSSSESSPRNSHFSATSRSPDTSTKTNICPAPKARTYFFKDLEKNRESIVELQKPTSIRLCAQDTTRPVNTNKTIVHLGKPEDESTGHIKVTIDLKNPPPKSEITKDSNSQENNVLFISDCSTKPTKKVGFCKTEVHFVADSGKVNIVETDGKPPPTNRFRRRRRNSSSSNNSLGTSTNKNLPVVHFGDAPPSYIFGENKKPGADELTNSIKLREEENYKDTWQSFTSSPLTKENHNETKEELVNEPSPLNIHEKNLDPRYKVHTTTINFGSNRFCNLKNIIQDDTSKLSNVEEVSLEAPKIISALDLRTRKETHNSPPMDNESLPLEDKSSAKVTTTSQRPIIGKIDFDNSQKLIKSKKPITLASLYPTEKSTEDEKLLPNNKSEKLSFRSTKSNEPERISFRLTKLNNESEKNSSRLLKSNESEKISTPVKNNEKVTLCPIKLSDTENSSSRSMKLNDVGKISSNLMKTNETTKDSCAVPISESKDACDVSSGVKKVEICDPSPIYANVFEPDRNDDVPIYENFQTIQNNFETEVASKKIKDNENQEKVQSLKMNQQEVCKKIPTQSKPKSINLKRSTDIRSSGSESNKNSLIRSKKESVDNKKEKKQNSTNVKSRTKIIETESNNRLKDQKIKDKSQEENSKSPKSSLVRKDLKRTTSKSHNSKQSDLGVEKNSKAETSKTKKPVEVIYKTAIYNMKNEKLTKPVKTKESKGPRYINDIICGSKVKKSSTDKHGKANATLQTKKC